MLRRLINCRFYYYYYYLLYLLVSPVPLSTSGSSLAPFWTSVATHTTSSHLKSTICKSCWKERPFPNDTQYFNWALPFMQARYMLLPFCLSVPRLSHSYAPSRKSWIYQQNFFQHRHFSFSRWTSRRNSDEVCLKGRVECRWILKTRFLDQYVMKMTYDR